MVRTVLTLLAWGAAPGPRGHEPCHARRPLDGAEQLQSKQLLLRDAGLGAQRLVAGHARHPGRLDRGLRRREHAVFHQNRFDRAHACLRCDLQPGRNVE